jgi:hypothetical protein
MYVGVQRCCQYGDYVRSVTAGLMKMVRLMEWGLAGQTDVLGLYLAQRHIVKHKSEKAWSGIEPHNE